MVPLIVFTVTVSVWIVSRSMEFGLGMSVSSVMYGKSSLSIEHNDILHCITNSLMLFSLLHVVGFAAADRGDSLHRLLTRGGGFLQTTIFSVSHSDSQTAITVWRENSETRLSQPPLTESGTADSYSAYSIIGKCPGRMMQTESKKRSLQMLSDENLGQIPKPSDLWHS